MYWKILIHFIVAKNQFCNPMVSTSDISKETKNHRDLTWTIDPNVELPFDESMLIGSGIFL